MSETQDQNEAADGQSLFTNGLPVKPLHLDVRGSEGITFEEGPQTGRMTEGGVLIETVWYAEDKRAYGGCIDRSEALQLRDFLNACIEKWSIEKTADNT